MESAHIYVWCVRLACLGTSELSMNDKVSVKWQCVLGQLQLY